MAEMKNAQALPHGGDWAGFKMEYGKVPLDFSMNVNPLGIPEAVQQAIAKAGRSAERYPDPLCRELTQRLAEHEAVPAEWIFCGNGAADIIFRLAQALKPDGRRPALLITAPTFSEYETAFAAQGWEVRRFLLQEKTGFRIGGTGADAFLRAITEDVDAVFLCEPNNPTGVATERAVLKEILRRCRQTGTALIIDECFNGFLKNPAAHSMKPALAGTGVSRRGKGAAAAGASRLIILKAFTKLYGMAGVRLGYCLCSDRMTIERLRQAGPPWNVSSLAQAAGIAALDAQEHVEQGLEIVHTERPWLEEQLQKTGIRRIYGEANYLLFHEEPGLDQRLREKGILIRDCSNYPGLGEGWYRIAVRRHEENERLIETMKEVRG